MTPEQRRKLNAKMAAGTRGNRPTATKPSTRRQDPTATAAKPAAPPSKPKWTIVRERFADIKPEYLTWLWPGVWLDGSLNLLTGSPGLGKTFVASHLAACVSKGLQWPDGSGKAPVGDVVFMSAEDSYAAVLVHRVKAAGGDLARVHRWTKKTIARDDGTIDEAEITLEDIDCITDDLASLPKLKLVILDPVTSYLGGADANDNAEVRRVLGKLVDLADARKFTVILITHDKKMNTAAINSPMGSTAFTALPRVVQGLFRDPEDDSKKKRLLLPIKNNHGDDRHGRSFAISTHASRPMDSSIVWDEEPELRTADEVKAAHVKVLAFAGKEQSEEEASKRSQVKLLTVIDTEAANNDGWIAVTELRTRTGMSGTTLAKTLYEMLQSAIVEEKFGPKNLPNGAMVEGGQKFVRRRRPDF